MDKIEVIDQDNPDLMFTNEGKMLATSGSISPGSDKQAIAELQGQVTELREEMKVLSGKFDKMADLFQQLLIVHK